MPDLPLDPLRLLSKSQQVALKVAGDTLRAVRDTAVTGVTRPEDLVAEVPKLVGQVAGLADAVMDLTGAMAQPLQDFVVRQRELADTLATLAQAQAELAGLVATLADRHADTVTALERLSAPVFALVGTDPTPTPAERRQARRTGD
ncbi:hypothetical protein [Nocardioides sp.]|uniref:hypothetical protein n=1 Tax=Nocardioides sp. TaxID=35761 RepID=UPI003513C62D